MTNGRVVRSDRRAEGAWLRAIIGFALVLVLAGCTDVGDPADPARGSADGRSPLVEPAGTAGPGLVLVDPSSGEAEPLLVVDGREREPERSPVDARVVYQDVSLDGVSQIFLLDEDGERGQLTDMDGGAWEPTWSPDGTQIAFAGVARPGARSDIFVMGSDGNHVRLLARTRRFDRAPDWSPDGTRIVFHTDPGSIGGPFEEGAADIWVAAVEDGSVGRLSHSRGDDESPSWSPDGRRILFTRYGSTVVRDQRLDAGLWVMRADGTGRRPIDLPDMQLADELQATWSPDGRSIAYSFLCSCIRVLDIRSHGVTTLGVQLRPRDTIRDLSWNAEGILGCWGCTVPSEDGIAPPVAAARPVAAAALPRAGAEPSRPLAGEVVARFTAQNMPGCGWCEWWVYADGRFIRSNGRVYGLDAAYAEQRLAPSGIELLRKTILSAPRARRGDAYNYFVVTLLDGERTRTVSWRPRTGSRVATIDDEEIETFYTRMADLGSWLPSSAWEDERIRAFIPSRYLVYGDPLIHPLELPPPADTLLRRRRCDVLSTEQVRALMTGFEIAGLRPTDETPDPRWIDYRYPRNRGVGYLGIAPALPHSTC